MNAPATPSLPDSPRRANPLKALPLLVRLGVHVSIASRVLAALVKAGIVVRAGRGSRGQPFSYRLED
jgi:hypothetical protein